MKVNFVISTRFFPGGWKSKFTSVELELKIAQIDGVYDAVISPAEANLPFRYIEIDSSLIVGALEMSWEFNTPSSQLYCNISFPSSSSDCILKFYPIGIYILCFCGSIQITSK